MEMFNNETGLYEDVAWLRDGMWLEDRHGNMWIIPPPEYVAEIEGPDIGVVLDVLNAACRNTEDG